MRSAKVKLASAKYNIGKARMSRNEESYHKQSASLKRYWINKQRNGWYQQLSKFQQEDIRNKLSQLAKNQPPHTPSRTGSIKAYGLQFDSQVELFFYEELLNRNIYAERPALYNGWLVDFAVPSISRYVEIKSWYTVLKLQGVKEVMSKLDENVLMLEEQDAYNSKDVPDIWSYLDEKSQEFKRKIVELSHESF